MTASKLSQGLIELRHHRTDRSKEQLSPFDIRGRDSRRLVRAASLAALSRHSFSLKRIPAGRSLCRFRAERRKVAHGFSGRFARQKNLLSSPAKRSLRRKDSFFGGGLRQAKRTFRHATSNAEKTLLYVKSGAEEKAAPELVVSPLPVVPLGREMAFRDVYICITGRSGQRKTRWSLAFADFSDLDRS